MFYKEQNKKNCIEMSMQFPAVAGTSAFGLYVQKDGEGAHNQAP